MHGRIVVQQATDFGAEIANYVVGAGTLALAGVTWSMARATSRMAKAADTDRELAWRPILRVTGTGGVQPPWVIEVSNVGAGPALNCRVAIRRGGAWWRALESLFIPAGGSSSPIRVDRSFTVDDAVADSFDLVPPGKQPLNQATVAVCRDALGHSWRFADRAAPIEVSADEKSPPAWVKLLDL